MYRGFVTKCQQLFRMDLYHEDLLHKQSYVKEFLNNDLLVSKSLRIEINEFLHKCVMDITLKKNNMLKMAYI